MFCGAECSHEASETFTADLKPCRVYNVRGLLATGTGGEVVAFPRPSVFDPLLFLFPGTTFPISHSTIPECFK